MHTKIEVIMKNKTIVVSGGLDPIHVGHIKMIQSAAELGNVIVVLNSDMWLRRKKGYVFMPFKERSYVLQQVKGVSQEIGRAHV